MSFTANFYVFSKKENSTVRPSGSPSFSYPIVLTENCSVMNPVVIVKVEQTPSELNYCYIAEFGRYYFVQDWVWNEGRWTARLRCDVLATYRAVIGNTNLYFLRSSTVYDGSVQDMLYPSKKEPIVTQYTLKEQWFYDGSFSYRTGWWILGIVSTNGNTVYYAMDYNTYRTFCDKVFGTIEWANLNTQEISDSLAKALFNPFQYVVSCMWYPNLGSMSGWFIPSSINFGWWKLSTETGVFDPYEIPDSAYIEKTIQLSFKKHPQAENRGEYLNKAPYRYCYLYINPFGVVQIDTNLMSEDFSGYDATMRVDLITGIAVLRVTGHNSDRTIEKIITQVSGQFGVPVQISDLNNNLYGAVSNTISSVSKGAKGDFLGLMSGIGNAVIDNIPNISDSKGINGSIVGISYYPTCVTVCYELVDEDNSDNGRPYCKNGKINELGGGYYVVENGSIAISGATQQELTEVRTYLEGGFYYA